MTDQKKVVIGGTFDFFHKGHRSFLEKASSLGSVKIGLTSDEMAKETKGVDVEPFEDRRRHLLEFLPDAEIEEINEPVGFAIREDFHYIVVSPETRIRAERINEERKNFGKEEIEIIETNFVLAEDKEPISSTRIREGDIDKEGKVLNK